MPEALDIEPGMWLEIQNALLEMQKYIADLEATLSRESTALQERLAFEQLGVGARATESAFMGDPRDFVALEEFRRQITRDYPRIELQGSPSEDWELQNLIASITEGGGYQPIEEGPGIVGRASWEEQEPWLLRQTQYDQQPTAPIGPNAAYNPAMRGTGYAGVDIPGANQYTRSSFQKLTGRQLALLTSFLRSGVTTPSGASFGIDPGEYFQDVEESFVPTIEAPTRSKYQY